MDAAHRFHTDDSWAWVRAEQTLLAVTLGALVLWNASEVDWLRFALAFTVIDLVGYLPGALEYRRRGGGPLPPRYHHLYNLTHSYLTWAGLTAAWAVLGGLEWAMLAAPIHLAGDRGLFGNVYKPASLPFEAAGEVPERSHDVRCTQE